MIERPYEDLYCDKCKNKYDLDGEDRCIQINAFNAYCNVMCCQVLECNHFEKKENEK